MKKILIISMIVLSGFLFLNIASAQASSNSHGESIEEVLGELLEKNQVSTVQDLECDQLSDEELERLGDAVMEQQHPGEAHEQMDDMMGGEGSDTLSNVHIHMGKNYLGCGKSYGAGMMGGGMMGYTRDANRSGSSSHWYFKENINKESFSLHYIFMGVTWFSLIAFLLSGVYFFLKSSKKKRK